MKNGLIFKITDYKGYAKYIDRLGMEITFDEPVIGEHFNMKMPNDKYMSTSLVVAFNLTDAVWTIKTLYSIYTIHIT